jgi:acyl-CoA synthetase (AMP-forming)/AMP-acid ligase II
MTGQSNEPYPEIIDCSLFRKVPLPLVAPAALAGLAYLNAKTSLSYDYQLLYSYFRALIKTSLREKKDRMNLFYVLEEHAQNKSTADKVLLIYDNRRWTYREVYETVLKYGTWLKKQGIKSKDVVALDYMNSDKYIFIWYGLWSIGARPAFINYNLGGKALAHCVRVSTADIVILDPEVAHNVSQDVRDDLPAINFVVFTPEIEAEVMSTEGVREKDEARSEKDAYQMAALIYTSGTTGLPKPAIVSYAKFFTVANHVASWGKLQKDDVYYTVSTEYHSICVQDFF